MTTAESAGRCANCGAPLGGRYCSACGQLARDLRAPLRTFLSEFAEDILSLDSRLIRTLERLLFRPGFLTQEYFAGRRASYVPPVRLYLVIAFVLFLLIAVTGSRRLISIQVTPDEAAELAAQPALDPASIAQRVFDRLPEMMFVLLPVFALMLKGLHPRRFYVEHLVFGLHVHAFAFLLFAVIIALDQFGGWVAQVSGVLGLAVPVYLLFAMRQVYTRRWWATVLGMLGLAITYMIAVVSVVAAVAAITVAGG